MPVIYRAMTHEEDKPKVGLTARTLGVRSDVDITPDQNGWVIPKAGGMSVAPSWRELPPHRIPLRLRPIAHDACGRDDDACWRMGSGAFVDSPLTELLDFRRDRSDHGFVEPSRTMQLDDFQSALAATRDHWEIDET